MARDDKSQLQEELDEALAEVCNQQRYRFLCIHLDSFKREAMRVIGQLEQEGTLDICSIIVGDIVQEALLEMYNKFESRPANLSMTAWFSQILSKVIDRNRRKDGRTQIWCRYLKRTCFLQVKPPICARCVEGMGRKRKSDHF